MVNKNEHGIGSQITLHCDDGFLVGHAHHYLGLKKPPRAKELVNAQHP